MLACVAAEVYRPDPSVADPVGPSRTSQAPSGLSSQTKMTSYGTMPCPGPVAQMRSTSSGKDVPAPVDRE